MAEGKPTKEFLAEAEELTESLEKNLFDLSESIQQGGESPDIINSTFRDFHTLKGIAGIYGFENLSQVAHKLETFLDRIRLGKVMLSMDVIDALFSGTRLITEILKNISSEGTDDVPSDDVLALVDNVLSDGGPVQVQASATPVVTVSAPVAQEEGLARLKNILTEYEEHRLHENISRGRFVYFLRFSFSIEEFDDRLGEVTNLLKQTGEVISTLPKPAERPGYIEFSIIYATSKTEDELQLKGHSFDIERLQTSGTPAAASQAQAAAAPQPSEAASGQQRKGESGDASTKSISNTVRVDIAKLDYLMNIVGELVTQKALMVQLIDQLRQVLPGDDLCTSFSKVNLSMNKMINELQEAVMAIRMVPLHTLFDKLQRNIKKIAHDLQKEIRVTIKGGDTELDKYIVEELADPLMHIVRNAIDHGIEPPDVRRASGKPETGEIVFSAYQKGNYVFIEVIDDGRGIDTRKIRQKLVSIGKLAPDQEASDDMVLQAIFMPGFSSKDEATELSGRGVGLDVVKNNITRLRGMVDVHNEDGKGTSFVLTLPLTLIIIQAVLLKTSGHTFALPVTSVEEIVEVNRDDLMKVSGEDVINLRNTPVPIFYLERIFDFGVTPDSYRFLIFLKVGEKRAGIIVEEIVGQGDIVIRPMGKYINVKGIAGATQIGDGKNILVLDPSGIVDEFSRV